MKMAVLRNCLLLVFLAIASCSTESSTPSPESILADNAIDIEVKLADLVNKHRTGMGLGQLQLNTLAYEVANDHNDYMIAKGTISHDNFTERASKIYSGTEAKEVGENVGKNFRNAQEALDWWLNSPTHRKNLESDFTHMGISVKEDNGGNLYYTHIFFKE